MAAARAAKATRPLAMRFVIRFKLHTLQQLSFLSRSFVWEYRHDFYHSPRSHARNDVDDGRHLLPKSEQHLFASIATPNKSAAGALDYHLRHPFRCKRIVFAGPCESSSQMPKCPVEAILCLVADVRQC
jgi:hypothetical protein